jgi:hypothetical protein
VSWAFSAILINLVSMGIGAALGYGARYVREKSRERVLRGAVRDFFGTPPGHIMVIHSAIFDVEDEAYNYPATDTRAARALAKLFESLHLREGVDFSIRPDREVTVDENLWKNNLVLVCGPARNSVLKQLLPTLPTMRYIMTVDVDGRSNILKDNRREVRLFSSRELQRGGGEGEFDCGLVASLPNSHNLSRKVVLLAGIHGTGTVGAAQFVTDPNNLQELLRRRKNQVVSEALRVDYRGDIETPTYIDFA